MDEKKVLSSVGNRRKVSLHRLQEIAQNTSRKTVERYHQGQQRRHHARKMIPSDAGTPTFDALGQVPAKVENSADVERWLRMAMSQVFPHIVVAPFLVQEQVLAKRLLKMYDAEIVERGIMEAVLGWSQRRSVQTGFHPAVPTIVLLWKMRQEIFGLGAGDVVAMPDKKKSYVRETMEAVQVDVRRWSGYCSATDYTAFSLGDIQRIILRAHTAQVSLPRNLQHFLVSLRDYGQHLATIQDDLIAIVHDTSRCNVREWLEKMGKRID